MRRALATALVLLACSKSRPLQGPIGQPVSWQEEIAPLFAADCSSCHSGAQPAGGYRTTSYLEALGPPDAPVAVAGDPQSILLQTLDPARADAAHAPVSGAYGTVRAWVVDGRLSLFRSGVHEGGILNPRDPQFHGALLQSRGWDFALCQKCHGADFGGGASGVSCTQCHAQGPTSCDTCHGLPPATGAHAAHAFDCGACHLKPARFDDPGHLDGGTVVVFGALAKSGGAAPAWDGARCSGVYCHGATLHDTSAANTSPEWKPGASPCGSCHGLPPSSHHPSSTVCSACHALVTPPGGKPINAALHVDGAVEVGDGTGTCSACHGSAQSPAPPRDLSGNSSPSALGVGAHQAHLTAAHGLAAPVACSACHAVPANLHDPGHIDHALPATVAFSGLAAADGAAPAWDRATGTCSGTYCHGGGVQLSTDTAFKLRKPSWTLGTSQAFCGSCHGLPPSTAAHAGVVYPDCSRCHPATITPNGGIVAGGPHLNGAIDVAP